MTDFEMDKMYTITGREFLALLSLIPDGDEKAKVIVENVAGREKSKKVKESQKFDFLKPCPFCGGDVELRDKIDSGAETTFIHCTECHMWFEKFDWRGYSERHIIEEWNRRVKGWPGE